MTPLDKDGFQAQKPTLAARYPEDKDALQSQVPIPMRGDLQEKTNFDLYALMLKDAQHAVRSTALTVILMMVKSGKIDADAVYREVVPVAENDRWPFVRARAVSCLFHADHKRSLRFVTRLAMDEDANTPGLVNAVRYLKTINHPSLTDVLRVVSERGDLGPEVRCVIDMTPEEYDARMAKRAAQPRQGVR